MSEILHYPETDPFQTPSIANESKKWADEAIWNIILTYPYDLKQNFEKLRDFLHHYILYGDSSTANEQLHLDEKFFRFFYRKLVETEDLEESYVKSMGISSSFGYSWVCFKIQQFYHQNNRPPASKDFPFTNMVYHCKKKAFLQYDVRNWNDLLCKALQHEGNLHPERFSIRGKAGLDRIRIYLLKNFASQKKLPRCDDPGMRLISNAIQRNTWVEFGIHTWRDLLRFVYKGNTQIDQDWVGKNGLDQAKKWLKTHYSQDPIKIKQTKHWKSIDKALYSHYWDEFGIFNWDDLTRNVLGIDNVFKNKVQIQKSFEELIAAKDQLKQFYSANHRIPKCIEFKQINRNCQNKAWLQFGVTSWHQLIQELFGVIVYDKDYWIGLSGLNRARDKLQQFYQNHKRKPNSRDKECLEFVKLIKYQF